MELGGGNRLLKTQSCRTQHSRALIQCAGAIRSGATRGKNVAYGCAAELFPW